MSSVTALVVAIDIGAAVAVVALDSMLAKVIGLLIVAAAGIVFAWALDRSTGETEEAPAASGTTG
jgi:multisubunit Na+/H+ antiporter MnhC subunit